MFKCICALLVVSHAKALTLAGPQADFSFPKKNEETLAKLTHAMAQAYRNLERLQDPILEAARFQAHPISRVPNPTNIAVVSVCISLKPQDGSIGYADMCKIAEDNFRQYCDYQGYELFFHHEPLPGLESRAPQWNKILAVQAAFKKPGIDYVFWMDGDSLFMNENLRLEALVPSGENQLTLTGDTQCFINTGHLMMKKGNWTDNFLKETWETYPPPGPWKDNSAMAYVLSTLPEKQERCRISVHPCCHYGFIEGCDLRNHHEMNSYLHNFVAGDFILHFAGKRRDDKIVLMKKYAQQAILPGQETQALEQFHSALRNAAEKILSHWMEKVDSKKSCQMKSCHVL